MIGDNGGQMTHLKIKSFIYFKILFIFIYFEMAQASVDLKTGNFAIGKTDISYASGGFEIKIERYYNSKTGFRGMFGWGWGCEYDTHLTPSADGGVVITEYGGGSENRFLSKQGHSEDLKQTIAKITKIAQQQGYIVNSKQLSTYQARLKEDAQFRNREWTKFHTLGKLAVRPIPLGTELHSSLFYQETLTKNADGYLRRKEGGQFQLFNEKGRLIKTMDKSKNFVNFSYTTEGHLQKLVDNSNRKMFFTYDTHGQVINITDGESKRIVVYTYNKLNELESVKNAEGKKQTYQYDPQKRHNLIAIHYDDHTSDEINYYGKDKYENVKTVKNRDGTQVEYVYENFKPMSDHLVVHLVSKDHVGKVTSKDQYEYFMKPKADGGVWTEKVITVLGGQKTLTRYNSMAMPAEIIKNDHQKTTFAYDAKHRLIKKVSPTEITVLDYSPQAEKVSKVSLTPIGEHSAKAKTKPYVAEFQYDNQWNLTLAKDSEGKMVKLIYSAIGGRILTLLDRKHAKNPIYLKYDPQTLALTQISVPSLDPQFKEGRDPHSSSYAIQMKYFNDGRFDKAENPRGAQVAQLVSDAFGDLTQIASVAGVTLNE